MKMSVIIPCYNEEATIATVLSKLQELGELFGEAIIVDDGSMDHSCEIINGFVSVDPRFKLICQERNGGKTEAVKRGVKEAIFEIVLIQDADLEYDPLEIPDVVDPILTNQADVVYGSRFLVKKSTRVLYFYHYLANKWLTFLSNLFTNLNMTDLETCYKAFRRPIIQEMNLSSSGYGMEVEITAKIAKLGIRIFEVPISYYGRTYEEGKKIRMSDGLWAIWYIFYYNLIGTKGRKFIAYKNRVTWMLSKEPHDTTKFTENEKDCIESNPRKI